MGYRRSPHSSQGQIPGHLRGVSFGMSLVSEAGSQALPELLLWSWVAFRFNPLKSAGSLSVPEPPIVLLRVKIIWFKILLYLTIPFPFRSFHHVFVSSCFMLLFQYHLVQP